jgi:putative ABC transport system ATP-binding protein
MKVLTFDRVTKKYGDEAPGVAGISFSVGEGEFLALAGPSGSGKTTLLNLAAGLDAPTGGSVTLLGHDLGRLAAAERARLRRRALGFVFQSFNLFPVLTVLENVEYPLALRGWGPGKRRATSRKALEAVGLGELGKRFPSELSGGQQQRVAVARAIVGEPKLVLADEPTANLDSKTAASLIALFEEMNRRHGITFLFSSHDPQILKRAKRTLDVCDGRITRDSQSQSARRVEPDATGADVSGSGLVERVI